MWAALRLGPNWQWLQGSSLAGQGGQSLVTFQEKGSSKWTWDALGTTRKLVETSWSFVDWKSEVEKEVI